MKSELKTTLKWDVKLEPIMLNSSQVACKKALLRNDNDALLGIVGKDYHPVTNYQLMGFTEALTKTGEFELKGFDEINNGKTILAFLQSKNQNLKLNGCAMKEYLIIGNSHDGTRPLYIGTGSSLIRCENQFYSTIKVFRKKHTSPVDINNVMAENSYWASEISTWSRQNDTKFKITSINAVQFDSIKSTSKSDDSFYNTDFSTGTTDKITKFLLNDVYAFRNVYGKVGLLKFTQVASDETGSIKVQIICQK